MSSAESRDPAINALLAIGIRCAASFAVLLRDHFQGVRRASAAGGTRNPQPFSRRCIMRLAVLLMILAANFTVAFLVLALGVAFAEVYGSASAAETSSLSRMFETWG